MSDSHGEEPKTKFLKWVRSMVTGRGVRVNWTAITMNRGLNLDIDGKSAPKLVPRAAEVIEQQ
jgi:hypothetical protein